MDEPGIVDLRRRNLEKCVAWAKEHHRTARMLRDGSPEKARELEWAMQCETTAAEYRDELNREREHG